MNTLALQSTDANDGALTTGGIHETDKPQSGFEIEVAVGATRRFASVEGVRAAIVAGEVPRSALLRALDVKQGASAGAAIEWTAVEDWAKSDTTLRRLYAPVWSLALKGAFVGVIGVGILKALDTLIFLFAVNPGAAILWLLIGAGMFSPKFNLHFMAASIFLSLKIGASLMALWAAWIGVGVFAAVFGATAGMAIGTTVGLLRAHRLEKAPDAASEGNKPLIMGLALPVSVFVTAAVAYIQVFVPAMLKALE